MTEQEQIEQLKTWIKQYGLTIIAGIGMALVIMASWHYWQRYQNRILTQASGIYDEMLTARAQNDAGAVVQANRLISHFPKTSYAQMAAFLLTREAVKKNDYSEAIKQLDWILKHSKSAPITELARVRMARILIAEKKPEAALDILKKVNDQSFNGLIEEVRGDAYVQMKNIPNATAAYKSSLKDLSKDGMTLKPLLQIKLDNLATATDAV